MAQAVCGIVGVFFLGMGAYALAAPAALIRPFGVRLTEPSARYEVRAVYGGFGVGGGGGGRAGGGCNAPPRARGTTSCPGPRRDARLRIWESMSVGIAGPCGCG
ncbi:DUF4345 family protein [Nocardia abscessus]|uniref:DUF4345 family protein n=1 Tax=Nocardia abscessus TaxID=120957 RepID=UPI0024582358|nr:DUF4345 family protein [Nocardia abscessus]